MPILTRKPGALRNGAPFKGWQLPNALGRLRTRLSAHDDGDRQFVKVLAAVQEDGLEAVEAACAEALDCGACSADGVLNILSRQRQPAPPATIPTPEGLQLRHQPVAPDRAETERELAFFRKHRHRMRYHALKEEGIAIGSGVVEAANKTLVTQRMKRSGMRWRIVGGQAVLTFRALIKSGRFERAWKALISATDTPANDNISPRAAAMAIAA